ncbi:fungal-specific transcription factor domain-containing protein [Cokeromyces recurvatus]|uniref:fungal-specific transcription factor domain-containing protein n=1 Tax=Cokeromyces recurvatus TaxID=90255 RepID=UPI00221F2F78|nr:fungal-specific transcription factor domain-containing protein [Cokeromyces recurvatus]KAI7906597.1 fungal-specific transcription factor domain-containing protein [Cokeromyces recurvatus]
MKHDLENKKDQTKPKRFKVGKACYTCRIKKIKCDGVQPCMQCKVRKRPCTFSKDGTIDSNQRVETDNASQEQSPSSSASTPSATPHLSSSSQLDEKQIISMTEALTRLNKIWPGEGREGKWEVAQSKLLLHPFPNRQLTNEHEDAFVHQTKAIQQQCIRLYYKHCYSMFPIVPKRLFYKQFDSLSQKNTTSSESYLLNPALILIMMAHGAQRRSTEEITDTITAEADSYFLQARSILLDNNLVDQPKISTVAALILMSLYESSVNPYPVMYSGIAFQMALDLSLMRDYRGEIDFERRNEDGDLQELRKRTCWGCYALDKLIHMQTGQSWMLRSKDIELDMPSLLPGDNVKEHETLEGFVALLKLLQIAERVLQPASLQQNGQPVVRTHAHDQMSLNTDNDLLHWLRTLPSQLQWTPVNNNSHQLPPPPSNAMVYHLHLIYNFIELSVLKPYSSSNVKSIHQRSAIVAAHITRLITNLSTTHTLWIFNINLLMSALMEATRFHLRLCSNDENLPLARQARMMFQQSMMAMKHLLSVMVLKQATKSIHLMNEFVIALEQAISEADAANLNFFNGEESDIMTPFVLGNTRYMEEERQQWSKLDYFANGLITPPTAKARGFTMSSTMFVPPNTFPDYDIGHSAITATDHAFSTRFYSARSSLDELLSNTTTQSWQRAHQKTASSNNNQQLLMNQSNSSDIAAFVAQQIQDNNQNSNGSHEQHNWPNHSTSTSNTTTTTTTTTTTNNNNTNTTNTNIKNGTTSQQQNANNSSTSSIENESLLYTLLSSNQERDNNNTQQRRSSSHNDSSSTTRQNYNSFVQPYMSIGLGIYASAHQHHNDVIRQHLPVNNKGPATMLSHTQQHQ